MSTLPDVPVTSVLTRLRENRPLVAVELRPPRSGMSYAESVDAWIDMYHSLRRLARQDTLVFLTDNAIGQSEEENLAHLTANLAGDLSPARVVPFLTAKHPLDYIQLYAARAESAGLEALTVVGGDQTAGPPRSFPHSYQLRRWIRERMPVAQSRRVGEPPARPGAAGGVPASARLRGGVLPHPDRLPPPPRARSRRSSPRPADGRCPIRACSVCSCTGAPTRRRWSSSAGSSRCPRRGSLETSRAGSLPRRCVRGRCGRCGRSEWRRST